MEARGGEWNDRKERPLCMALTGKNALVFSRVACYDLWCVANLKERGQNYELYSTSESRDQNQ